MNYLAIDTSADHLTVAACVNGKKGSVFLSSSGVKHSVELMPEVEKLLNSLGATAEDMDVFCAVVGPGSFTGIRIGVATAKGFADACGKKVLAVTAFDTIAYNIQSGKVLAVIDANHSHYYVCGYTDGKISFEAQFVSVDRLIELKNEYGLYSFSPINGVDTTVVSAEKGLIKAVEASQENASDNTDDLKPFYLRLSQAEEGRK